MCDVLIKVGDIVEEIRRPHHPGDWREHMQLVRTERGAQDWNTVLNHRVRRVFRQVGNSDSELLAALKGIVRILDRDTVEFDAARAAIAKAQAKAPSRN
jgi:hypothetical protein